MEYEGFPEPQTIKSKDPLIINGMNKSGRHWKVGMNKQRKPGSVNHGLNLTWEQKKKRAQQLKDLRSQIKDFKQKKIKKRKQMKEIRKQRKKQRQLNEIKSGKFQVIKNPKKINKWTKKMKQQLVKLPAQVFQALVNK